MGGAKCSAGFGPSRAAKSFNHSVPGPTRKGPAGRPRPIATQRARPLDALPTAVIMPALMRHRPLAVAAAFALAVPTCSSSSGPAIDALAVDLAQAFCHHQFRCCSPYEIIAAGQGRYANEAECIELATLSANQQLAVLESAIAARHVTVDPAVEKACVQAYADRACNTSPQSPEQIGPLPDVGQAVAGCAGLFVGHVPAHSRCDLLEECVPGTSCVNGSFSASGACFPYRAKGDPCNASTDCDPSAHLFCRSPEFVCDLLPREGEACGVASESYGQPIACDPEGGLTCDFGSLVCRRLPRAGEPCASSQFPQCDPNPALALLCNFFTGTCMAPAGEGDACGGSALPPCRGDLACHPTQSDGIGVCGALPTLGEPCNDRCASPAICSAGVCTMPGSLSLGAPCSANEDCATLACYQLGSLTSVCSLPQQPALCVGSDVTPGGSGMGVGGSSGAGGKFGTGVAGAAGGPPTGAGGMTGGAAGGESGMAGGPGSMTGAGDTTGAGGST